MRQHRTGLDALEGIPRARPEPGRGSPAREAAQPAGGTATGTATGTARGLPGLAVLFVLSLLPQVIFHIGPLLLKPYRIVLLVLFLPLLARLLSGAAGKVMAFDWLMIGASLWAVLALIANHPIEFVIEPAGIFVLELLGAYLIARVCIRSAEDFVRVVRSLFLVILVLLVFAAIESVTHRPILLQLLGQTHAISDASPRWGLRRAQAVFSHSIHYGIFVSAGLGLVWYAFKPGAGLVTRAVYAFLIAVATLFSLSTGALIAYNVQCLFIAWEMATAPHPKRWRIFALGAIAGYCTLDFLSNRTPFHVLVDYASFSTGSAYGRINIWTFGTDNVIANPVFGIGLNDWERPSWMGDSVDNFWLLLTMQNGLPFIALLFAALYLIVRRVSRQALTDPVDRACRAGYLVTFGGIAIAGGTVHYWHAMFAFVLFLFGMGVWTITGGAKPGPAEPVAQDRRTSGDRHEAAGDKAPPRKRSIL